MQGIGSTNISELPVTNNVGIVNQPIQQQQMQPQPMQPQQTQQTHVLFNQSNCLIPFTLFC